MGSCISKKDNSAIAEVDHKVANLQIELGELNFRFAKYVVDNQYLKDEHTNMANLMVILARAVRDMQLERTPVATEVVST